MLTRSRIRGDCHSTHATEDGLTLVEVMIALMILAILAIAMVPFFQSTLTLSSSNISRSTATQLVGKELDVVRTVPATCAGIKAQAADANGLSWTDPRGVVLQIHRSTQASCPGTYPALMAYSVAITRKGKTQIISNASIKIYVGSQCGLNAAGNPITPCP